MSLYLGVSKYYVGSVIAVGPVVNTVTSVRRSAVSSSGGFDRNDNWHIAADME